MAKTLFGISVAALVVAFVTGWAIPPSSPYCRRNGPS
jgi:hypothetical protein